MCGSFWALKFYWKCETIDLRSCMNADTWDRRRIHNSESIDWDKTSITALFQAAQHTNQEQCHQQTKRNGKWCACTEAQWPLNFVGPSVDYAVWNRAHGIQHRTIICILAACLLFAFLTHRNRYTGVRQKMCNAHQRSGRQHHHNCLTVNNVITIIWCSAPSIIIGADEPIHWQQNSYLFF